MKQIILTVVFLLVASQVQAVTIDAFTSEHKGNSGTTITKSHTVTAAGGNRAIYVLCSLRNLGYTLTATYAGEAMTEVAEIPAGASNLRTYLFRKTNPTTGANDWVVTQSTGTAMVCGGLSLTNVHQTTPETDVDEDCTGGASPSLTLTTATNELVVNVIGISALGSGTEGANQTEVLDQQTTENTLTVMISHQAGGDGGAMTYTTTGGVTSCHIAVSVAHSDFSAAVFGPLRRRY